MRFWEKTWVLILTFLGGYFHTVSLSVHACSTSALCLNVHMHLLKIMKLPYLTELKPTLHYQENDTAHTHTHTLSYFSHTPYLSNSVSLNSFYLKLCFCTHIHRHTCSPHPAKRKRWLVNKQWHSAHSVTRLGFDQHRCSCSPQQSFPSFLPAECCHARTLPPITQCLWTYMQPLPVFFSFFLFISSSLRSSSLYLYLSLKQQPFELVPLSGLCCILLHAPS